MLTFVTNPFELVFLCCFSGSHTHKKKGVGGTVSVTCGWKICLDNISCRLSSSFHVTRALSESWVTWRSRSWTWLETEVGFRCFGEENCDVLRRLSFCLRIFSTVRFYEFEIRAKIWRPIAKMFQRFDFQLQALKLPPRIANFDHERVGVSPQKMTASEMESRILMIRTEFLTTHDG